MPTIKERVVDDLKEAMKAGDTVRRDTLRMLDSAIKNTEIEKKKKEEGLSDQEVIEVIRKSAKQRNDSIEQYEKGGRSDLADKEKKEMEILSVYLPKQLGDDRVKKVVSEIIAQVGANSKADTGKVMGATMGKLKGQADGNVVKRIVEEELK
ncbi:glutamyl-tRNA(Gln) amidotransferase subunit E [bacterium BMS3Abin15]|nr:glutamyl-tRNA(Gln) amidotransferase subunit E [bacterium BMS3Abin15]HDH07528.1 GatB/YqeY domain-containing protein [Candidatus Moranbacteria bacterium]HDZ85399.1 GatB/YqeY domain-containing protein [Candidatus Moranbacteria bacterium]